jgi:hypothetical protein
MSVVQFQPHMDLSTILCTRGVHALCTVVKSQYPGKVTMRATHYATVIAYGSSPMWAVWTANGKFVRFAGSRGQIEREYPHLVWRRRAAAWTFSDFVEEDVEKRKARMLDTYKEEPQKARRRA